MSNYFFSKSVSEVSPTPQQQPTNVATNAEEAHGGFYRNAAENYRDLLASEKVMVPRSIPRVLLIDDDPTFGKMMMRAARAKNVPITYCKNLVEFRKLKNFDFDVFIVDFDLGEVNGSELTRYMEQFSKEEIPTILISQTNQTDSNSWASTIREFVHKRVGPYAILDAAFEAHEVNQILKMVVNYQ
jgi:PleD family two-component response regulator